MQRCVAMTCLVASFGAACTLVVDRDRFDDGDEGSGGAPAITGTCVRELFHVGFDEPTTDAWYGDVLSEAGVDVGIVVPEPVRWGAGAWRIELGEAQSYSVLRSLALDELDTPYWAGWSDLHEGPMITYGTGLFALYCLFDADPWQTLLFGLQMDPTRPKLPYSGYGVIADLLAAGGAGGAAGFDHLEDIVGDHAWSDWAAHVQLSRSENGFFELYRNGELVFAAAGPNVPADCPGGYMLEFGLSRWEEMAPKQALVQDEITLLKGPEAPLTDADALYTLRSESACFDTP